MKPEIFVEAFFHGFGTGYQIEVDFKILTFPGDELKGVATNENSG